MLASVLSNGNSVRDLSNLPAEYDISQVFIAIEVENRLGEEVAAKIQETIDYFKGAEKESESSQIFYPNEMSYTTREDNLQNGIPVDQEYWDVVLREAQG